MWRCDADSCPVTGRFQSWFSRHDRVAISVCRRDEDSVEQAVIGNRLRRYWSLFFAWVALICHRHVAVLVSTVLLPQMKLFMIFHCFGDHWLKPANWLASMTKSTQHFLNFSLGIAAAALVAFPFRWPNAYCTAEAVWLDMKWNDALSRSIWRE